MMMKFLESKRRQVIVGNLLWLVIFLFQSLIIFGLLKYFFDFSFTFTYLQVCMAHLLVRILKADLPVETMPSLFQQKQVTDVKTHLDELEKQIKKINF